MRLRVSLLSASRIADAVLIAGVLAWFEPSELGGSTAGLLVTALVVPLWLLLLDFVGLYQSQRVEAISGVMRKLLSAHLIGFALLLPLAWLMLPVRYPIGVATSMAIAGAALLVEKVAVYSILHVLRTRGIDLRNACVVSDWPTAERLSARMLANPHWGLRVTCVAVGDVAKRTFVRYPTAEPLGGSLEDVLSHEVIDEVIVAVGPQNVPAESVTLQICQTHGVVGRVLMAGNAPSPRVGEFLGEPALMVGHSWVDRPSLTFKRLIDIILAAVLLILLSPLLILVAAVIKLSSSGPVIFRQDRIGFHGRRFVLYKFRTMVDGAESLLPSLMHRTITRGPVFKDPDDFRITPFGRLLRRFSVDELPQLFNVLRGEMSLVGPRPLPVHESVAIQGPHRRRFSMRPGITCLWQVNGRSTVDYQTWMNYDLMYVDDWSLVLDAKLLLRTIPVVLSGRGAY